MVHSRGLRPDASPDAAALRAWAKECLSAYKVPHLLAFVDTLPRARPERSSSAIDRSLFDSSTTSDSAPADTRGGAEG